MSHMYIKVSNADIVIANTENGLTKDQENFAKVREIFIFIT